MTNRFPFTPYPTGWFGVAFSHEVKPAEVKALEYFGRELVLFRTASGTPVTADAYCPHMGAHLGHGGSVSGETIRCPFHYWVYSSSGACVEVPFCNSAPPSARLNVWPTVEQNGLIYVWHDLAGRAPLWQMPVFDESLSVPDARQYMTVDIETHPQEILENVVDCAHFHAVHGVPSRVTVDRHAHVEPPIGEHIYYNVLISRTGAGAPKVTKAWVVGPGCARNVSGTDAIRFTHTLWPTPTNERNTRLRVIVDALVNPGSGIPPERVVQMVRENASMAALQLRRDIAIWCRKAYVARPLLSAADGPLMRYRNWYSQFYPDRTAPAARAGALDVS